VYISCSDALLSRIEKSPSAAPITSTTPKNATMSVRLARIDSLFSISVSRGRARGRRVFICCPGGHDRVEAARAGTPMEFGIRLMSTAGCGGTL